MSKDGYIKGRNTPPPAAARVANEIGDTYEETVNINESSTESVEEPEPSKDLRHYHFKYCSQVYEKILEG